MIFEEYTFFSHDAPAFEEIYIYRFVIKLINKNFAQNSAQLQIFLADDKLKHTITRSFANVLIYKSML